MRWQPKPNPSSRRPPTLLAYNLHHVSGRDQTLPANGTPATGCDGAGLARGVPRDEAQKRDAAAVAAEFHGAHPDGFGCTRFCDKFGAHKKRTQANHPKSRATFRSYQPPQDSNLSAKKSKGTDVGIGLRYSFKNITFLRFFGPFSSPLLDHLFFRQRPGASRNSRFLCCIRQNGCAEC
jgi:hypothetical protein